MTSNQPIHNDLDKPVDFKATSDLAKSIQLRLLSLAHAFNTVGNDKLSSQMSELAESVAELEQAHSERGILSGDDKVKESYLQVSKVLGRKD